MAKKVFIVQEGEWGQMHQKKGDYDSFVRRIKEILEEAERPVPFTGGKQKGKVAEVQVVTDHKPALEIAQQDPRNSILVFVTRGMLGIAEEIKAANPKLKVVLFTGLFPEDRVVIATKVVSRELVEDIVLDW
ncbi:MAG: hypothetical protein Q7R55_00900 [Candidatus Wildermuthbacteria bacterium]|nr:hypothetical protein [Candidatus Wildermuthbacteria bacterium]